MRLNQNEIILQGECTWSKLWPFNDKPYTSLSVRINVERDVNIFVDVGINDKDWERSDVQSMVNTIISSKPYLLLIGSFANKKDKEGKEKLVIKSNISSLGIVTSDQVNSRKFTIGGYAESYESNVLTLKIPYRNPKENKTLYRIISLKDVNKEIEKGDSLFIQGLIQVNNSEVVPEVVKITVIKSFKTEYKPKTANQTIYEGSSEQFDM